MCRLRREHHDDNSGAGGCRAAQVISPLRRGVRCAPQGAGAGCHGYIMACRLRCKKSRSAVFSARAIAAS